MTSKQIFEYALVELNKREAPSLLLEDYNYFINKAVNQYINRVYNIYDINQQKTDDLRVLKSSAVLTPTVLGQSSEYGETSLFDTSYEVDLPDDYLHVLNCVVEYKLQRTYKCYDKDSYWHQGATRLTADMFSQIINNFYLRPCYKRPYYYINNNNITNTYPTTDNLVSVIDSKYVLGVTSANLTTSSKIIITLTDGTEKTYTCTVNELASAIGAGIKALDASLAVAGVVTISTNDILIKDSAVSNIRIDGLGLDLSKSPSSTRVAETRYGNKSKVRMEIRYGKDDKVFKLNKIFIDYLKAPQFIRLTQDQIDEVEDNSQIVEFPDYVCQEIVNELIKLLMENASDPRLQTHIPISQSIANPQQEQQQQQQRK